MRIKLYNQNVLVKAIKREEKDSVGATGIYIPTEDLEDEQVSQGVVVQDASVDSGGHPRFFKGDVLLFHKTLPVDVNIKLEGDSELQNYFFIQLKDIICKII